MRVVRRHLLAVAGAAVGTHLEHVAQHAELLPQRQGPVHLPDHRLRLGGELAVRPGHGVMFRLQDAVQRAMTEAVDEAVGVKRPHNLPPSCMDSRLL